MGDGGVAASFVRPYWFVIHRGYIPQEGHQAPVGRPAGAEGVAAVLEVLKARAATLEPN
jgi:hypothetical protein